MATLIGPAPPGLTFQDLVGPREPGKQSSRSPHPEQARATARDCPTRNHLMRIYLPEGVVRVMALTRCDEVLLSFSIQDNRQAAEVTNRPNRGDVTDDSKRSA